MKELCEETGKDSGKIFPHNLRHLFVRRFYSMEKDIAKLADILGHGRIETTGLFIKLQYNHRLESSASYGETSSHDKTAK